MRVLWTLAKVVLVLALCIPVAMIVLPIFLGMIGALVGLAALTIRLGFIALIAYGVFRLGTALLGSKREEPMLVRDLPRPDPYYEAAKRELDQELGEVSR